MKSPSNRQSLLPAPKKKTVKVTSFKVCIGVILLHFIGIFSHLLWLSNQTDEKSHESSSSMTKWNGQQLESPSLPAPQLRSISKDTKVETNVDVPKHSEIPKEDTTLPSTTVDTMSRGTIISQPRSDFDLAENVALLDMQQKVGQQLQLDNLQSCRWYRRNSHGIVQEENICNPANDLWVYNPASYQRTWCDMTLPPETAVSSVQPFCFEPPRIFPRTPTVSAHGMPPIHLVPTHGRPVSDPGEPFECDVPCETTGSTRLINYHTIQGTNWKFTYSMEGSHYYPELNVTKDAYLEDSYFATTSFQSDVPLPYFSWAEYNITDPAVEYDLVIAGASFIARNCDSLNHREAVVETLMTYIRVDALSSCLHNAEPPKDISMAYKKQLQREYLFHLAFENSCEDDYITEKLWGALESGTLPVYLGAPNVQDHVPPHSIISVHDFESTEALGVYLQQVAANKTLYDSYHAWRTHPLPDAFQRKFNFTHTHSICRTCRWAYAKKYGLGWDHATQRVEELPRQLGRDENGKITTPFRESWLSDKSPALNVQHSSSAVDLLNNQEQQASQKHHESKEGYSTGNVIGWERTVWEHDGVIDLSFETSAIGVAVYRMETNITGSPVQFNSPSRTVLQDNRLRMTLLTSWNATMSSPRPGTIDFMLEGHGSLRMRVIVESVDTLHEGGHSAMHTYYFGSFMAEDFFQPIELFHTTKL